MPCDSHGTSSGTIGARPELADEFAFEQLDQYPKTPFVKSFDAVSKSQVSLEPVDLGEPIEFSDDDEFSGVKRLKAI
jgi:hypothetical protein